MNRELFLTTTECKVVKNILARNTCVMDNFIHRYRPWYFV